MTVRHRRKKQRLERSLIDVDPGAPTDPDVAIRQARVSEQLSRYPVDDRQVLATRLGNAIRAFETYGYDRYCLDSQRLWTELTTYVPEALRTEIERARASVDFCVSSLYLATLLGTMAGVTGFTYGKDELTLFIAAIATLLSVPAWYALAVISTRHWQAAVQALVNVGRLPLAEALGLVLPRTFQEERNMWAEVDWLIGYGYDDGRGDELNRFRSSEARGDAAKTTDASSDVGGRD
jgi:hypothetical protein